MNYNHLSHTHCWNNGGNDGKPPCGIPMEKHKQCCLCDLKVPNKHTLNDTYLESGEITSLAPSDSVTLSMNKHTPQDKDDSVRVGSGWIDENKHNQDITNILDEFRVRQEVKATEKTYSSTYIHSDHEWLREKLQSQADEYEREKKEMVKDIHDFLLGHCGKKDCLRGQCQTVHIRRNAWKEIKAIAQKYGVDLSE